VTFEFFIDFHVLGSSDDVSQLFESSISKRQTHIEQVQYANYGKIGLVVLATFPLWVLKEHNNHKDNGDVIVNSIKASCNLS